MSDSISRERAIRRIIKQVQQREPVLTAPHKAVGLAASHNITAFCNVPEQPCSIRDGFAMRTEDIEKSGPMNPVTLTVTHTVRAESIDSRIVSAGTTARVLTGGLVPEGADCVLAEEDVEISGDTITVRTPVRIGWFIRAAGGEIEIGSPITRSGSIITAQAAAVMIRTRNTCIRVHPIPTAEVISLGSELSDPTTSDDDPESARFPADNLVLASSLLNRAGADVIKTGVLPDDESQLIEALSREDLPDILITTGGTGRSERDFARNGATQAGFSTIVDHVDIRPGKNMFVATKDNTILFGLPGPPAAVFACFHGVILDIIRHLRGLTPSESPAMARFEEGLAAKPGGDWLILCEFSNKGAVRIATPLIGKDVPPMLAMGKAHGVAIIKGGDSILPGGDAEILSVDC